MVEMLKGQQIPSTPVRSAPCPPCRQTTKNQLTQTVPNWLTLVSAPLSSTSTQIEQEYSIYTMLTRWKITPKITLLPICWCLFTARKTGFSVGLCAWESWGERWLSGVWLARGGNMRRNKDFWHMVHIWGIYHWHLYHTASAAVGSLPAACWAEQTNPLHYNLLAMLLWLFR